MKQVAGSLLMGALLSLIPLLYNCGSAPTKTMSPEEDKRPVQIIGEWTGKYTIEVKKDGITLFSADASLVYTYYLSGEWKRYVHAPKMNYEVIQTGWYEWRQVEGKKQAILYSQLVWSPDSKTITDLDVNVLEVEIFEETAKFPDRLTLTFPGVTIGLLRTKAANEIPESLELEEEG